MQHYEHLDAEIRQRLFYKQPCHFSKKSSREKLAYALGATLYIPAIHPKLYTYLKQKVYKGLTSLVICLEDAIGDEEVFLAEERLHEIFRRLYHEQGEGKFRIDESPLLFIRIREKNQMERILQDQTIVKLITGIVVPKFKSLDGEYYFKTIEAINKNNSVRLYLMPILETPEVLYLENSQEELFKLHTQLNRYKESVLNIRVGATDLLGLFGIRRSIDTTIYDIGVIRECFSKIVNVFGRADESFVLSGPVWEFFSNEKDFAYKKKPLGKIEKGLIQEIKLDKLNGFIGKTIIHPSHIHYVNALQVVTKEEYHDALQILNKFEKGVLKSDKGNKMNEIKPHTKWAKRILRRAEIYGVINEDADYTELF